MIDRREALQSLIGTTIAGATVEKAIELPADAKILMLSFTIGDNVQIDVEWTKKVINDAFREAGLKPPVLVLLQGLEYVAAIK